MKKLTLVALSLSLASAHGVAKAEFYLGGDVSHTSFEYSDVDNATGYQFGAGYSFDNNLSVEVRYLDSGTADVDGSVDVDDVFPGTTVSDMAIELSGFLATVSYAIPLGSKESWDFFLRGGLYNTDTEASASVTISGVGSERGSVAEDTTGLTLGLGLEWMVNDVFGFRASVDGLINNNDFADDNNVTVLTVGTIFRFGSDKGEAEE